ncbi:hypothetical protein RGE_23400 [Rubrivivax gelatinosus IL144]|uniref:Uncharacterized protein n=1 Tax=Rubrivivax gelatinosus (strain NBRC 100245 / IL144) TaxID=983917 RepID=I0HRP4_RUBGI|nr:hypothetical protein RGE_23400 [Rubrivivax gelatinosus IL144]
MAGRHTGARHGAGPRRGTRGVLPCASITSCRPVKDGSPPRPNGFGGRSGSKGLSQSAVRVWQAANTPSECLVHRVGCMKRRGS